MSRPEYAADFERARKNICGHVMKERQSRSFDFRTPSLGSFYAYSLTWTPGTAVLAGDLGELTVTHWHAMRDFQESMVFLAGSHWDYLLGKTKIGAGDHVPDVEGTVQLVMEYVLGDPDSCLARRVKDELGLERAWGKGLKQGLRRRLAGRIEPMGEHELAEFCYRDLQFDDFYGCSRWHPQRLAQITAIQRAAAMVIAEVFPYEWLR